MSLPRHAVPEVPGTALRIVFAGSPAAAVPSLHALVASRHEVVGVLTRQDSARGRHRITAPTAVAEAAAGLGLPQLKANRLTAQTGEALTALQPDLGVIVAYGAIVREPLLSMPRLGWINLHFSLLPRWRGAAPVQWAVIAGDEITGACVFQLVPELDAGDVYGRLTQSIPAGQTAGELLDSLARAGAPLLRSVVDAIADGSARAEPQAGDVTIAPKLEPEDGRLDWSAHGVMVANLIRGVTPEPGAFTMLDGARLKVLRAAIAPDADRIPPGRFQLTAGRLLVGTATDPIELTRVQPAGGRPMAAADWWRGRRGGATVAG
jgi:methionyl-tRNA formyltransferase